MPYEPRDWWEKPRPCDRPGCETVYIPKAWNQKYCSPACRCVMSRAEFKRKNPDYWANWIAKRKADRKKPDSIKPQYNPAPCRLCKRPLGRTANRYYHTDCH